ncbi:MAG: hypothetical protein Q7T03_08065 [Deltaproteobacteria bacterium]|nr:hypothetical protein [Deltaproteobacteria bacterium]
MALKSKYSFLQRFNFEALYNTFLGLQPREQIFALVGAGVAVLLLVGLPISLASAKLGSLEEQISQGHDKQRDILHRLDHYQQLQQQLKTIESQITGGFDPTITTTMETLAEKSGLKERIENIKERGATPSELFDEVSVDVRLTKVTLPQLIDYLYSIEHHPNLFLKIRNIQIKRRYDNKQLLDASFQASTYKLQGV